MVHRLREAGLTVIGFEAGYGVGGTWYWNRYPGARCDSESMYYSFSFLSDLEQEWPLEERYPGQPQILDYLEHVADRLELKKTSGSTPGSSGSTSTRRRGGGRSRPSRPERPAARWVITAVGCLSTANIPEFPGAETFAGAIYHTGRGPMSPVTSRAGGSESSVPAHRAIQAIPVIAETAGHLTVFQRTAQFSIPAANGPLNTQMVEMWKANYPEWRRRARHSRGGFPYTSVDRSALEVSPEERRAAFEAGWEQGGFMFTMATFSDLLINEEANATAVEFVHSKIDEIVGDPDVAEILKPREYPFGTKRLPLDTDYFETFNRPNVALVDLRRTPILEITPTGVRTSEGQHDLDILVYATGFDALTGPLLAMDIRGRSGRSLADPGRRAPRRTSGWRCRNSPTCSPSPGRAARRC